MTEQEIDNLVGTIANLAKRTKNRALADEELNQLIDMTSGVVLQVMLDLHSIAASLESIAEYGIGQKTTSGLVPR